MCLISKELYESLEAFPLPELQRLPLEDVSQRSPQYASTFLGPSQHGQSLAFRVIVRFPSVVLPYRF